VEIGCYNAAFFMLSTFVWQKNQKVGHLAIWFLQSIFQHGAENITDMG
jgi:hypothetical protein